MSTIKPYITDEDIININDLVSELAVILRKFEIDLNPYQTDVYFYYDADAKIVIHGSMTITLQSTVTNRII